KTFERAMTIQMIFIRWDRTNADGEQCDKNGGEVQPRIGSLRENNERAGDESNDELRSNQEYRNEDRCPRNTKLIGTRTGITLKSLISLIHQNISKKSISVIRIICVIQVQFYVPEGRL